jgi:hypothetical protein
MPPVLRTIEGSELEVSDVEGSEDRGMNCVEGTKGAGKGGNTRALLISRLSRGREMDADQMAWRGNDLVQCRLNCVPLGRSWVCEVLARSPKKA